MGMASTTGLLKRALSEGEPPPGAAPPCPANWPQRPLKLAPYVCAALVPRPYAQLKQAISPGSGTEQWARLASAPMTATQRQQLLARPDPRLVVARAEVTHQSRCEATVDLRMAELSEGFAPLLGVLDGKANAELLVGQLRKAGAPDKVLQGVQGGLKQLLDAGMLQLVG